jgi:hypothetical protein
MFKGLIENHRYRFRVRAVNKEGKSEPLETSGVYEAKNPFEVPSKPGRPKVKDYVKLLPLSTFKQFFSSEDKRAMCKVN